jgi:GNAT superfamily N-acetyltransferase
MTPFTSSGFPPAENGARVVQFLDIFHPRKIELELARQVATFADPCAPLDWLAGQLAREPKPQHFVVLAIDDGAPIGYGKFQHGRKATADRPGDCIVRELVVDPLQRRRGIGSAIIGRALYFVRPHAELIAEIREGDTAAQLFLRAAGLDCQPPWTRVKRQRQRRLYEFRSVQPAARPFKGRPRFTWPAAAE